MSPLSPLPIALSNKMSRHIDLLDAVTQMIESDDAASSEIDVGESECAPSFYTSSSRVRFAAHIEVNEIISLQDFTEKEIKKCWYSPEEKEKIHAKKDKIVERIEAGRPAKKDMTYRGLECWTTEGGAQLDGNIARVIDAVMDEQEAQWARTTDDYDLLAEVSLAVTEKSKVRAREIGLQDELEALVAWEAQAHEQFPAEDDKETFVAPSKKRDGKKSKTSRTHPRKSTTSPKTKKSGIKVKRTMSNDAVLMNMQQAIRKA